MEALLAALIGVVTKAFLNHVPSPASLSIEGVCIIWFPAYPIASHR